MTKVKKFGNVVACGSIAGYNNREALKVSNWGEITVNSLTVRGFIVTDYQEHFPKAIGILTDAVKAGKIRTDGAYHVENLHGHDLIHRLENIPKIWNKLLKTTNQMER